MPSITSGKANPGSGAEPADGSSDLSERRSGYKEALLFITISVRVCFGLVRDYKVMQRLLSAGLKAARSADAYFASRLLRPIFGMACGSFIHHNTVFRVISSSPMSYLARDVWLTVKGRKRRRQSA